MKNSIIAVFGMVLCACLFTPDAHAEKSAGKQQLHPNVRILIEISEVDKPVTAFAIVGSEGRLLLDNIAGMVKVGDSEVPAILSFQIMLQPQGDSIYTINYSYSLQLPVITGSKKTQNGSPLPNYVYKDLAAQGTVNMAIGDKLEVLKDPKRTVVLKLEHAEKAAQ